MNKRLWIVALVLVFVGLPMFLTWNFFLGPVLEVNTRFRNLIGKTESEVVTELGVPRYRVSPEDAKRRGIDYNWRKMNYQPLPDRPVLKEVLLYEPHGRGVDTTPFAVYIFIGNDGRVEAVDFAGT